MKLIFDTETTGMVHFKQPASDPLQPRLVQLAGIVVDKNWAEQSVFSFVIRPDNFEIPVNASNVHGITTEKAYNLGIPILTALSVFNNTSHIVDEVWAFNAQFDSMVIHSEMIRARKQDFMNAKIVNAKCAMLACKDILRLPSKYTGRSGDFKWPSLAEAYAFFYDGAKIENAHDALTDVRATVKVMQAIEQWQKATALSGAPDTAQS